MSQLGWVGLWYHCNIYLYGCEMVSCHNNNNRADQSLHCLSSFIFLNSLASTCCMVLLLNRQPKDSHWIPRNIRLLRDRMVPINYIECVSLDDVRCFYGTTNQTITIGSSKLEMTTGVEWSEPHRGCFTWCGVVWWPGAMHLPCQLIGYLGSISFSTSC